MTSPLPLIIIYNQNAPEQSILVRMNDKIINNIDASNFIEMDRIDSQINMKDRNKYKCISLKEVPVVRDKCFTTKIL
jgi:hypothetical protein